MIVRDYIENLYSNKQENLEEIGKFLGAYDLLNLTMRGYINHLNISIMNEFEAVIVSQKRKASDQRDSSLNSTRLLMKD
jgi:hypothetical protein